MMDYVSIARRWRQHNPDMAENGIVLIWKKKVYGWKNCLRDAQDEQPGAIAVDCAGNIFIAEGGNDYDGAKCWVVLDSDKRETI
ncbi:antirestriction protein ArdR [Escherichia coli]|nr:antirestriction protein ArdR [Salmonella enterica]EKZ3452379.1 antirestriction protein ArdR [Escherichia coli]ELD8673159.1 antirestriction protein ArdR [Escherichia coli]ELO5610386.1 antirestriction protein ArdR [Escherichia coli]HBB0406012.1 antirestriction protein ArdR [Escherichia coli]